MNGWRPIRTAPKTPLDKHRYGPQILLWVGGDLGVGFWDQDFNKFYIEYPEGLNAEPTYWRESPKPPKPEKKPR